MHAADSEIEISVGRGGLADAPLAPMLPDVQANGAVTRAGLRRHAEQCNLGVVVASADGTITYANEAFRRLAGAENNPVLGRTFFDAFPLLACEHVRTVVGRAVEQGCGAEIKIPLTAVSPPDRGNAIGGLVLSISSVNPAHEQESAAAGANSGSRGLLLQIRAVPLEPQIREPDRRKSKEQERRRYAAQAAISGELLEVNQRLVVAALREEELKERAEEASKAKSLFLATMSHELRTPLNAIIGYASLLDEEIWGPLQQEQHVHLQRLRTSAHHLLTLINDVLALARVEANDEVLHAADVDAASLLDEALTLTIPLAIAKHLRLSVLRGTTFSVRTDRGKLLQILVNLVGNATKFTDKGQITLSAEIRDGNAEFGITDTGIGISPTELPHLFDMFWQADQDLTRRAGGSGLGLNVSRKLADLLGGYIKVDSTPNEGSSFTVVLPLPRSATGTTAL